MLYPFMFVNKSVFYRIPPPPLRGRSLMGDFEGQEDRLNMEAMFGSNKILEESSAIIIIKRSFKSEEKFFWYYSL